MVRLSPKAAAKAKALLTKEGKRWLRVRVSAGGCSGLSYEFELVSERRPDDRLYEADGAGLLVDPKSEVFLEGAVVDHVQSLMKSAFVVTNPNATGSCSCGTSFSVQAPEETSFSI